MRVMQLERQQDLLAHLAACGSLPPAEVAALGSLAAQLHRKNVLPVVGAGASYDCGMRLGTEISEDLFAAYRASADFAPHDEQLGKTDLPGIAEAMYLKTSQTRVVSELGLPDRDIWRPAADMGDHFCVYSVIARMVREKLVREAFGFNYDCGAEAAFKREGFAYGNLMPGKRWIDRARTVADGATNASLAQDPASFTLFKANGCAERFRELAVKDGQRAAEEIVVRTDQIARWKVSAWSRPPFENRAQNHVLMLIGFAAQDPKISNVLRDTLEGVYQATSATGVPRVVAIDYSPNSTPIDALINTGLGGAPPATGAATRICTKGSTATAALLILMTEMLTIKLGHALANAGVILPSDLQARVNLLSVSAPSMQRWSYLVEEADENLIQRANALAHGGYIPLGNNAELAARQIAARMRLRETLDLPENETADEAMKHHGFIPDPRDGCFYMPVGMEQDRLAAVFRPGVEHQLLRRALSGNYPAGGDCILVSGDGSERRGVSLSSGREVNNE